MRKDQRIGIQFERPGQARTLIYRERPLDSDMLPGAIRNLFLTGAGMVVNPVSCRDIRRIAPDSIFVDRRGPLLEFIEVKHSHRIDTRRPPLLSGASAAAASIPSSWTAGRNPADDPL